MAQCGNETTATPVTPTAPLLRQRDEKGSVLEPN
jgi:hypothetical protein